MCYNDKAKMDESDFSYYSIHKINEDEYYDGSLDIIFSSYEEAESALLDALLEHCEKEVKDA